jgi:hypothetical protein
MLAADLRALTLVRTATVTWALSAVAWVSEPAKLAR